MALSKLKLKYFLFAFLSVFALACSQGNPSAPSVSSSSAGQTVSARAGDFAPGQLEAHYAKHGYQFGGITQDQYLAQARELLDAATGNDVLEKTRDDGDVLRYRVSTGEFAVMAANGRIRTYFKTDYRYWSRQ